MPPCDFGKNLNASVNEPSSWEGKKIEQKEKEREEGEIELPMSQRKNKYLRKPLNLDDDDFCFYI